MISYTGTKLIPKRNDICTIVFINEFTALRFNSSWYGNNIFSIETSVDTLINFFDWIIDD